jgi:regulation of enolase protein 1 (concanavalin A-like superfamily)
MNLYSILLLPALSLMASALAHADETLALPGDWFLENQAAAYRVLGPRDFELVAPANTDLFVAPDGNFARDLSPRLVTRPAKGPFVLTAKIRPGFGTRWDAGVLVLVNDAQHFMKFCFEQDYRGTNRVVSVVCNGVGDDCNSMAVPEDSVYFRIAGSVPGNVFTCYSSADGKTWFLIRSFRLEKADDLRIGFSAQSPAGKGCAVRFSEVSLESRAIADVWAGD